MTTTTNSEGYRADIDGLRALAVLAVVLFHLEFSIISGGFVGVDVFFVISGFLITTIIVKQINANTFSLLDFYSRRVKRLMPAVLSVIIVTLIASFFILTPDKYEELAKTAIMSTLFSVNFWFALNSGYFDQAAELAPFLHLWSLAVEEQYYFFAPILLIVLSKVFGKKGIVFGLCIVTVTSFSMSTILSPIYPDSSYYLLHTRAWELGVGGLISFYRGRMLHGGLLKFLQILGVVLLVLSFLLIKPSDTFPGFIALVPVIGASLLIVYRVDDSFLTYLLTNNVILKIGKASYSIYLWHWPIIVLYRVYISERHFDLCEQIALLTVSMVLGWLSFSLIEEKFRYVQSSIIKILSVGIIASSACFLLSFYIYSQSGFPERISQKARLITDRNEMQKEVCNQKFAFFDKLEESFCILGGDWETSEKRALLWGDSHSIHWSPIFDKVAKLNGFAIAVLPKQCPPYLDGQLVKENYPKFPRFTEKCALKYDLTKKFIQGDKRITHIVLAAAWSGHIRQVYNMDHTFNLENGFDHKDASQNGASTMTEGMLNLLGFLEEHDKKVLIVGDMPRITNGINVAECKFNELQELAREKCDENYSKLDAEIVRKWHFHSEAVLGTVSLKFANTRFVSLVDEMCDAEFCELQIEGEILYRDSNHLRQNLSENAKSILANKLLIDTFFSDDEVLNE